MGDNAAAETPRRRVYPESLLEMEIYKHGWIVRKDFPRKRLNRLAFIFMPMLILLFEIILAGKTIPSPFPNNLLPSFMQRQELIKVPIRSFSKPLKRFEVCAISQIPRDESRGE